MSSISLVEKILPEFCYPTEKIIQGLSRNNCIEKDRELVDRLFLRSGIKQRYFSLPLEKIKEISGNKERAELYRNLATKLCANLLDKISTNVDLKTITHIITTSCTVPIVPALDTKLISLLGLSPHVKRLPIFQHGCVAGAIGLSLASDLAATGGRVLLLSVELCSLLFAESEAEPEVILGNSLFADGAACAIITSGQGKFKIVDTRSVLIPETACFLGYEIKDQLTKVLLKKEIVATLNEHAPSAVKKFLEEKELRPKDISWWLIHPGGHKIILSIEESLEIPSEKTQYSWNVLSKFGNVSSAAILFVLSEFEMDRQYKKSDLVVALGMGPGMSVEIILLECL